MSASTGELARVYAGITQYAASIDGVSIAKNVKNHIVLGVKPISNSTVDPFDKESIVVRTNS